MTDTITLTGDYGYKSYKVKGTHADVINASGASWTLANIGSPTNPYPFGVVGADPDLAILGGTINGLVSQTLDWEDAYVNSAGIRVEDAPKVTIQDWRISQPWDGIRLRGNSNGFTIENVWLSGGRDDAVENDDALGGTIRNSLFDGFYSGISTDGDRDGSSNTLTLDHVLMRSKSYLYKGEITHTSPFKTDKDGGNPSLRVIDSIIAIENVKHEGMERLKIAFSEMTEVKDSYYLNLSDAPLPGSYPKIPTGFTVLQGKAARDFWDKARADWIERREAGDPTGPLPDPDPTPTPDPEPTPVPGTTYVMEVRIALGNDDVEESRSGVLDFMSSDLELVDDGSSKRGQTVGLRFTGVDIPKEAVVTRAYVQFQVDETNSGTAMLRIHGEDVDNAAAFVNTAFNISSRSTTSASAEWKPMAWKQVGEAGSNERTSDISAIIQEIVERPGWAADNSIAFIITGTGERTAESYDGKRSAAPMLHVEWELPDSKAGRTSAQSNGGGSVELALASDGNGDRTFDITPASNPSLALLIDDPLLT